MVSVGIAAVFRVYSNWSHKGHEKSLIRKRGIFGFEMVMPPLPLLNAISDMGLKFFIWPRLQFQDCLVGVAVKSKNLTDSWLGFQAGFFQGTDFFLYMRSAQEGDALHDLVVPERRLHFYGGCSPIHFE